MSSETSSSALSAVDCSLQLVIKIEDVTTINKILDIIFIFEWLLINYPLIEIG